MNDILANEIFKLEDLTRYKLHLACADEDGNSPLDAYVADRQNWIGWNEWKGSREDWTREYIFSLIEFYPRANSWLFGGIFRVREKHADRYVLEEMEAFKKFEGRVLISFYRYQGLRGRAYYLENHYNNFILSDIFPKRYDGEIFPGFQNINHDFSALEPIFKQEKTDWKTALLNMKGVYLITDKSNGEMYVGSAFGEAGIWSRLACYIGTGHDWNDQLTKLITEKGISYARTNFKFSMLEMMLMNTTDNFVLDREFYWKKVLLSREFGYNSN